MGLRDRGRRLRVDILPDRAPYRLLAGVPLELLHHDVPFTLAMGAPQSYRCPLAQDLPDIGPPPGRPACGRGVGADADDRWTSPLPRQ
jgi:hypothetical protein